MTEITSASQTTDPRKSSYIIALTKDNRKKLATKQLKTKFLVALDKFNGNMTKTCKEFNISVDALNNRREEDKDFDLAIYNIKQNRSLLVLNDLEEISQVNAYDPKQVVERMFQLKALDRSKYAPNNRNLGQTQINIITAGVDIAERQDIVNRILGNKPSETDLRLQSDFTVSEVEEIQSDPTRIQKEDMV